MPHTFPRKLPNMLGRKNRRQRPPALRRSSFSVTPAVFAAGAFRATVHAVFSAFPLANLDN
jgi:hypothetical protein